MVDGGFSLILVPVLLWWIGTGLVLRNSHLPPGTAGRAVLVLTALLPLTLVGLTALSNAPQTPTATLASLGLVFLMWAWLEASFYSGHLTGPVNTPCPSGAGVVRRLVHGLKCSAYHEAAMVALGGSIWVLSGGAARWAPALFLLLAAMHTSARVNVLLGVRNLNEQFLPVRMRHLESLFRRRAFNALMPMSLLGSAGLTWLLVDAARSSTGNEAAALVVLATVGALGLVEHLLLIVPLPVHRLFDWGLPSGSR